MKNKRFKKKKVKSSREKPILHIVKRREHTEIYDERKVYGSCFFACRNAHLSEKEAEEICNKVTTAITKWVNKQKVVYSNDIFRMLTKELGKYSEDSAFLYETHRDIS